MANNLIIDDSQDDFARATMQDPRKQDSMRPKRSQVNFVDSKGRPLEEENKNEVLIPLLKKEVFAAIQAFVAELGANINAASLE